MGVLKLLNVSILHKKIRLKKTILADQGVKGPLFSSSVDPNGCSATLLYDIELVFREVVMVKKR